MLVRKRQVDIYNAEAVQRLLTHTDQSVVVEKSLSGDPVLSAQLLHEPRRRNRILPHVIFLERNRLTKVVTIGYAEQSPGGSPHSEIGSRPIAWGPGNLGCGRRLFEHSIGHEPRGNHRLRI